MNSAFEGYIIQVNIHVNMAYHLRLVRNKVTLFC